MKICEIGFKFNMQALLSIECVAHIDLCFMYVVYVQEHLTVRGNDYKACV